MRESIERRVRVVVARHFSIPPSKVRLDDAFVGDLGGDALDTIELASAFETAFDVRIPLSHRDSLATVRSVVDFLRTRNT